MITNKISNMNKTKIKNIILAVVSTFIAVCTAIITVTSVTAKSGGAFGGTSIGVSFFRYYTSLSNIFVALISIAVAVYALRNFLQNTDKMPKWLIVLYLVGSTGTTVTFLTTTFFLTPLYMSYGYGPLFLFGGQMFFLHLFNPVLAIGVVIFLLDGMRFNIKHALLSMSTVFVYSCVYSPMVITKTWEDFYGFTFNGNYWAIPIVLVVMYSAAFGIAFLLALFHNLFYKKTHKE